MRNISKAELGWMAAVIDMKGGVSRRANKSRRTPQLVLVVDTKDPRIGQRLAAFTGSKAEVKAHMSQSDAFLRRGCTSHCPEAHIHVDESDNWHMPEITRWTVTGAAMAVVLVNLAPFMSTYEDYADDVDEVTATMAVAGRGSGAVRAAVKRLEGLGWQIPREVSRSLGMKQGKTQQGERKGNERNGERGECYLGLPGGAPVPLGLLPGASALGRLRVV